MVVEAMGPTNRIQWRARQKELFRRKKRYENKLLVSYNFGSTMSKEENFHFVLYGACFTVFVLAIS